MFPLKLSGKIRSTLSHEIDPCPCPCCCSRIRSIDFSKDWSSAHELESNILFRETKFLFSNRSGALKGLDFLSPEIDEKLKKREKLLPAEKRKKMLKRKGKSLKIFRLFYLGLEENFVSFVEHLFCCLSLGCPITNLKTQPAQWIKHSPATQVAGV